MAIYPLLSTVQQLIDVLDDLERLLDAPTHSYICDRKAMDSTPMDVKEYPNSHVFIVDIPGLKPNDIKVKVEDENIIIISGEWKRKEKEEGEVKCIRMECGVAKFMRKFTLPTDSKDKSFALYARLEIFDGT